MSTKSVASAGSVPSSTGTGAGSASNNASGTGTSSASPTGGATGGASVVAPKGFRLNLEQMLAGWQSVIPAGSSVPYQGSTLGQAAILAQLQGFDANYTTLDQAELAIKAARSGVAQSEAPAKALLEQLKVALSAFFGPSSPQLALFGLKPKAKAKPLTAMQAAVRVAKVNATRALRGTKGKLQKADLKSGPLQVSVGPVASTAAPSTSASAPGSTSSEAAPAVVAGK